jgi:hypothetical protein
MTFRSRLPLFLFATTLLQAGLFAACSSSTTDGTPTPSEAGTDGTSPQEDAHYGFDGQLVKDVVAKDVVGVDASPGGKDAQVRDVATIKDVHVTDAPADGDVPDGQACLPLETPCNSVADCCTGARCAQVGGLEQAWCCAPSGGACASSNDCCGAAVCDPGTQQCRLPTTCSALQTACGTTDECCPGAQCAQIGGLAQTECCSPSAGACGSANDCCGQLVCNGAKACADSCLPLQTPCTTVGDCCIGAQCAQVGGLTQTWCCAGAGGACSSSNDCCGQLSCGSDGTCQ